MENRRSIIKAITLSAIFALLVFFYYFIDKLTPWWCVIAAMLTIAITFVLIVINVVRQVIKLFKNWRSLTSTLFLPLLIYLVVLLMPKGSAEIFESGIKFRACYEGTQNQAFIKFRTDQSFELHWTGVFYSEWYTGKWQQKGNVLLLQYDRQVVKVLGQKLLIDNGLLKPLDASVPEKNREYPMFYLGYCKGAN